MTSPSTENEVAGGFYPKGNRALAGVEGGNRWHSNAVSNGRLEIHHTIASVLARRPNRADVRAGMGPGRAAIDDDIIGGGRIKIEAQAQRSINNVRRTHGSEAGNDPHERAKNQRKSFHLHILQKQHCRVNAGSINYEGLLSLPPAVRYSGGTLGNPNRPVPP